MFRLLTVGSFLFFISCTSLNTGAPAIAPKAELKYLTVKNEVQVENYIDSKGIIEDFLIN